MRPGAAFLDEPRLLDAKFSTRQVGPTIGRAARSPAGEVGTLEAHDFMKEAMDRGWWWGWYRVLRKW